MREVRHSGVIGFRETSTVSRTSRNANRCCLSRECAFRLHYSTSGPSNATLPLQIHGGVRLGCNRRLRKASGPNIATSGIEKLVYPVVQRLVAARRSSYLAFCSFSRTMSETSVGRGILSTILRGQSFLTITVLFSLSHY